MSFLKDMSRRYYGICPKCREDKFIGHGPLCIDCYLTPTNHE
jgi:hypothetical protein